MSDFEVSKLTADGINEIGDANSIVPRAVAPLSMIAEKLGSLFRDAQALSALDPFFVHRLGEVERLARGLEPYIASCTSAESSALASLEADTSKEDWRQRYASGDTIVPLEQEMLSGHVEGQFLKLLIHAVRATRVLEIGLFTGYSALAMAEALPDEGTLIACELDPYAANFAERAFRRSPHGKKIRILIGDAVESVKRLSDAGEAFDVIFIDADKASYSTYFKLALEGALLAPNGLICVDNTLMQGQPYLQGEQTSNGRAITEFNRLVNDDARVEQVLLPLRDGLTIIRRS